VPATPAVANSATMAATPEAISPVAAAIGPLSGNAPVASIRLPFSALGAFEPIHLRGISDTHSVGIGVRLDRVVTAAQLHLVYTYSPALIFSLSHIRVLINKQVIATVPFDKEHAGSPTSTDIPLDPRFFADFNQLSLELVAHYTTTNCEDPSNSVLWADISPLSEVLLDQQSVALQNDLALLPVPFFDARDSAPLELPFVLPASPSNEMIHSAAVRFASQLPGREIPGHAKLPQPEQCSCVGNHGPSARRSGSTQNRRTDLIDGPQSADHG